MDLEAAIARLWTDARPRLRDRLAVLEAADAALRSGGLEAALRRAATAEAHTLAGTLGTFGELDGTSAARALEAALPGAAGPLGEPLDVLRRLLS